jgi:hypothetical protein
MRCPEEIVLTKPIAEEDGHPFCHPERANGAGAGEEGMTLGLPTSKVAHPS